MCHRWAFRENINEKYILWKNADNGIKRAINECEKLKAERYILFYELNEMNKTNYEELLKTIKDNYYDFVTSLVQNHLIWYFKYIDK